MDNWVKANLQFLKLDWYLLDLGYGILWSIFLCPKLITLSHIHCTTVIYNNNIIYFNLTSQYYKRMKLFLSLLSERREMRASKKCHPGFGCRIKPRSSCTRVLCATVCATPHPYYLLISNLGQIVWIPFRVLPPS